jgi:tetratricopeptide (TPR) repeat protein
MKAYILYAQDGDGERTKRLLLQEWRKDTTRLDLLQEVAKVYYYQEDYDSAFYYFEKFVAARDKGGLDIYPQEDVKIARVYEKMGLKEQAANFFDNYVEYCEKDQSIYKSASMAVMYAYKGEYEKAVEQLRIFSTQDNYQYWILLFQDMDPILKPLEANPEYRKTIQKINDRFWKKHATIEKVLAEKGLL